MDVVLDFLIEVLLDNLINITLSVIPENKRNEKTERFLAVVIAVLTVLFLILFVVGICFLGETEGRSILGKIFISLTPLQLMLSGIVWTFKKIKETLR